MKTKAEKAANERWKAANKDKQRVYRYRSYARKFIRDMATAEDLQEFKALIHDREEKEKKV
ncbi:hypothetical protein lacNasYZ03_10580 [Lactobacillus nasalidis]|uniref:Phage protein n=1 Tax=Lactobacillus nasalidis TaxID=2797258 RepID=A0ABQ3W768_9LACO|nr:hypothetical protein [Lactobacillus nasalidis]GHV97761.1 hypothetical protein lacNasYZ01_09430 [Lactobacillus nasalidis]GHW00232.1 hypothetical protein lacNasYZ02_16610 [Lactobacillus nasalidis]GHW01371.1 hypothetical protein lacNasYZ03_10580 [Lactobacillus nasalidis]